MALSIWDDGYGISVSKKYQTTKESISKALKGFEQNEEGPGLKIYTCKGWDYPGLCEMYQQGIEYCRENHVPVLFHIEEMTQPQGHSTSGSHERYKSKERLDWEEEYDCIRKMREWILSDCTIEENGLEKPVVLPEQLDEIETDARKTVRQAQKAAWKAFTDEINGEIKEITVLIEQIAAESPGSAQIIEIASELKKAHNPVRKDVLSAIRKTLQKARAGSSPAKTQLVEWYESSRNSNHGKYNSALYSESACAAVNIAEVKPQYDETPQTITGREVLLQNFDHILQNKKNVIAFGEDLGQLGGVNQGFEGMQAKHGEHRVFDTGIREATIIGQGIGMAMRGLRPIAEIQYLDYLLYAIQILSDDLATIQYRTKGGQKAPLIIRTRGHRLEGIWHSGSPLGMIINAIRGIYVLTPRNMTQASGFYNTMLESDDPALIIEPLNAYRLKEEQPLNPGEYRVPLGVPEVLHEGTDVTIVTYGSLCNMSLQAVERLEQLEISVELIDAQSLLPFDIRHTIVDSLKKTNRILFLDEDVPGGASAYMMQKVLEEQNGYYYLDSAPKTLSGKDHRPAYGTDGDYFSKPNIDDIIEVVYGIMHEVEPKKYPSLF